MAEIVISVGSMEIETEKMFADRLSVHLQKDPEDEVDNLAFGY